MNIKIDELEQVFLILINKAIKQGILEFKIDTDYYWNIAEEDRENFKIENPKLEVGSLIDDWESLKKVLNGTNIPTTVDIERLGNVISFIASYIEKSDKIF